MPVLVCRVWYSDWYSVWRTDNITASPSDWYTYEIGHEEVCRFRMRKGEGSTEEGHGKKDKQEREGEGYKGSYNVPHRLSCCIFLARQLGRNKLPIHHSLVEWQMWQDLDTLLSHPFLLQTLLVTLDLRCK